jgi:post-segregation antitoxin (ccd killing protein)
MSEETSQPRLVLKFRNTETHQELRRMAKTLGVSMSELAEVAIQQELAAMEGNLERKLEGTLALLGSFQGENDTEAAEEFSRSEATIEDPLRAHKAGAEDAYRIGAAFARRMERG